jgi:hypothetical protein
MNTKKSKSKKTAEESATPVENAVTATTENPAAIQAEAVSAEVASQEAVVAKKKKPVKTKVIRDSFSFPEHDYRMISDLKKTCLSAGTHVKKGEILRAGLHLLSKLELSELTKVVEQVEKLKTGRPNIGK